MRPSLSRESHHKKRQLQINISMNMDAKILNKILENQFQHKQQQRLIHQLYMTKYDLSRNTKVA